MNNKVIISRADLTQYAQKRIEKLENKLKRISDICEEAPAIDTELSLRILDVIEGAEDE